MAWGMFGDVNPCVVTKVHEGTSPLRTQDDANSHREEPLASTYLSSRFGKLDTQATTRGRLPGENEAVGGWVVMGVTTSRGRIAKQTRLTSGCKNKRSDNKR
jgi:hypothetical protein